MSLRHSLSTPTHPLIPGAHPDFVTVLLTLYHFLHLPPMYILALALSLPSSGYSLFHLAPPILDLIIETNGSVLKCPLYCCLYSPHLIFLYLELLLVHLIILHPLGYSRSCLPASTLNLMRCIFHVFCNASVLLLTLSLSDSHVHLSSYPSSSHRLT